jgi:hypothetical protein
MVDEVRERVIRAHFRDLRKRSELLPELHHRGYTSEAMMIACCYIEAAGKKLLPAQSGNKERFVRAVIEYGGVGPLALVHPKQLVESLPSKCRREASEVLSPRQGSLLGIEEARDLLSGAVHDEWLDRNLWRGTLAAIAYELIRNQAIHSGRAVPITFDETRHEGKPLPPIDFDALYSTLGSVLEGVEAHCLSRPETFDPLK